MTDRLPDAAKYANPNCTTCHGRGTIEVPDPGHESASTEYCPCWTGWDADQPLNLDAIEARANNSPSGPWSTHDDWPGRVFSDDPFNTHIARTTGTRADASAEFIAHARTDVPAMVAEIRRLTADVDLWRRTVTRTEQGRDRAIAEIDRLTAELQQAQQLAADVPGTTYPSMGDAVGAAMAHNARMAAKLAATRAAHQCTDPAYGPCSFDRAIPPTDPAAPSGA